MSNRLFTLYGANARRAFFMRETTPGLSSIPRGSADVAAALLCAKCDRLFKPLIPITGARRAVEAAGGAVIESSTAS